MELIDIIKDSQDFKSLLNEYQKGLLSKSILLISPDVDYMRAFAKALAILIEDGQIDKNSANYIKIENELHSDVLFFPSKDKLLVADSEKIVEESFVKPTSSSKKIFIISSIDNSMESAQNKLLKTLEEPPKNVYFLLTSSQIEKVLPTVRSRCNKIALQKLSPKQLSLITGFEENDNIIKASDNLLTNVNQFAKMSDFDDFFSCTMGVLSELKNTKQVLAYSKNLQRYLDRFDIIMNILLLAVEDMILIKSGLEGKNLKDKSLLKVSDEYTIKALIEIQNLIDKASREKSLNVSPLTIIENLLLKILEVKYLCR